MYASSRSTPIGHARGFTLVELMVTLGVIAILTVIAVPNFNSMINSNRLTTAANEIVGALNTARMEAIKRNAYTQFCSDSSSSNTSDTLGTACGTNSGMVFVQLGPASTSTVFAAPPDLQMPIQISGHINAIRFHGDGLGYAPGSTAPYNDTSSTAVADLCTAALKSNNHIKIQMATGSIITSSTSTATCP
jgi:type IV fimbrial biogenesis protein FimT